MTEDRPTGSDLPPTRLSLEQLHLRLAEECRDAAEAVEKLQATIGSFALKGVQIDAAAVRDLQGADLVAQLLGAMSKLLSQIARNDPAAGFSRCDIHDWSGLDSFAERLTQGAAHPETDTARSSITFF
ncbi:MAG: hypothetical protein HKN63_03995 [Rhodobacteraceae bacterium]|nr:hypothetical protein [Paracoccaceae bacterium]